MVEKGLYLRDVQQDEAVDYCALCGRELYEGDDAYFDGENGVYICDDVDCLAQWAEQYLSDVVMGHDY